MPAEQSVAESRAVGGEVEDNVVMRFSGGLWMRGAGSGRADDSGHSTQTGAHAAVVDDPPLGEEHPIHEARIA
jgi:hypothetical protein